ncbi:hypothetical protein, partial [Klebsiella pneumoniae]|uniref:hypothetical protein n=1 Tax=Klebsiella pneumoniae TaxID=573 RepID=UPI0030135AB2
TCRKYYTTHQPPPFLIVSTNSLSTEQDLKTSLFHATLPPLFLNSPLELHVPVMDFEELNQKETWKA